MSDFPSPLTSADCDLRDFQYMPLDVVRLRDSDLTIQVSGEEFRCAVMLWCASWHQVPAASLPDDSRILASLAGFGRAVGEWEKCKAGALRGWIKCSDGRLYHPVVAEKANESWAAKHSHAHRKLLERLRKKGMPKEDFPTFDQWFSAGIPKDWPPVSSGNSNSSDGKEISSGGKTESSGGKDLFSSGSESGIPAENSLKGEVREHKGINNKTSSSSADDLAQCPVDVLVAMYHELLPKNPRVALVTETRKKLIRSRWNDAAGLEASPFGYASKSAGLEAWKKFFAYCAKSDFLTGQAPSRDGKKPFRAGIDFLFSPSGFAKTLEGSYHNEGSEIASPFSTDHLH